METTKISFGFNKTSKRTNIIPIQAKQEVKKVELVECLEGQSIKVKDAVEEVKQPLVIPLKDDQKNLLDRVRAAKKRDRQESKKNEVEDTRPDSELSVDELAARQLIKEAKARLTNGSSTDNSKISILPLKQDTLPLDGEKEPTLDDYESVPITDYGLAILRGMGWKEGMPIGKNASKSTAVSVPELRPKGLGLGATKVVQSEMPAKKAVDNDGNELILMKGAFAKVIAGAHKGHYCQVQGFDEEAGRVIIKVHPAGDVVNINELMLAPVTKEEFSKGSKILNNAKYEEYKEISDKKLEDYKMKQQSSRKVKEEHSSKHSKSKHRGRSRSKSGDRHRKHKKHASRHRESSESDGGRKERRKKNKCKSRHRRNSSSSSKDRQCRSKR